MPKLTAKVGDLVVRPANEAQVLKVAAACVKYRVPVTVRGAGTGNYGQCVPLQGGVIVDMTKMQEILWVKPGVALVEAGVKLAALDKKAHDIGWEMRMTPSTYRTATIGGFIAGGSGGIGSIQYGLLGDRGNLLALKVIRHICLITKFGQALANADGIIKKEIGIFASPIPEYFTVLRQYIPDASHAALLIIAEPNLESLSGLLQQYGGKITYQKPASEAGKSLNLKEFTWNHTTLHARSEDTSITYLQSIFPNDNLQTIEHMYHHFGDEVMMHLEFIRGNGAIVNPGLQLVRFTSEERLNEIICDREEKNVFIANPHSYFIEEGWRRAIVPEHLKFKEMVDPYNLMNPGKSKLLST